MLSSAAIAYRLSSINTFVDNRKELLRRHLEAQIQAHPETLLLIQSLGKHRAVNTLIPVLISDALPRRHAPVVAEIAEQILRLRARYERITRSFAVYSAVWVALALLATASVESAGTQLFLFAMLSVALVGIFMAFGSIRLESPGHGEAGFGRDAIDNVLRDRYSSTYRDRVSLVRDGAHEAPGLRFGHRYSAVARLLQDRVGTGTLRVLDLGCGDGAFSPPSEIDMAIVRQDVSTRSLASIASRGDNGHPVQADAFSCPYTDETFDVVILIEVVEHVLDPRRLLREAARVCKRSGRLIVTAPNLLNGHNFGVGAAAALWPLPGHAHWPPTDVLWHRWRDDATGQDFPHRLLSPVEFLAELRRSFPTQSIRLTGSSSRSDSVDPEHSTEPDTLIAEIDRE